MALIPDVAAGTVIAASWGNAVRDQGIVTFPNAGTRDSTVTPTTGRYADVADTGLLTRGNGTVYVPIPGTLIKRADRQSSSTATATEAGVVRLAVGTLAAGVTYKICTTPLLMACSAGATVDAIIRYTTDGSTPSTSSTIMDLARVDVVASYQSASMSFLYTPATAVNLTLLLTCARSAGSGNAFIAGSSATPTGLWVEVKNLDPGDTGVDI